MATPFPHCLDQGIILREKRAEEGGWKNLTGSALFLLLPSKIAGLNGRKKEVMPRKYVCTQSSTIGSILTICIQLSDTGIPAKQSNRPHRSQYKYIIL